VEVLALYALARRWIWLLIPCIIAGSAIAFLFGSRLPATYESTATLLVGHPFRANSDTLAANRLQAQTYADLAILRPSLQKVVDAVGVQKTPEDLAGQVIVRASRISSLLTVTVSDTNPDTAAAIANAVADELIALSRDRTIPRPTNVPVVEPTVLTVAEPAVPAAAPSSPKVALITALGAAGGLLVAVSVIIVVMAHRASRPQSGRVAF